LDRGEVAQNVTLAICFVWKLPHIWLCSPALGEWVLHPTRFRPPTLSLFYQRGDGVDSLRCQHASGIHCCLRLWWVWEISRLTLPGKVVLFVFTELCLHTDECWRKCLYSLRSSTPAIIPHNLKRLFFPCISDSQWVFISNINIVPPSAGAPVMGTLWPLCNVTLSLQGCQAKLTRSLPSHKLTCPWTVTSSSITVLISALFNYTLLSSCGSVSLFSLPITDSHPSTPS